jgi:hypothetical protein
MALVATAPPRREAPLAASGAEKGAERRSPRRADRQTRPDPLRRPPARSRPRRPDRHPQAAAVTAPSPRVSDPATRLHGNETTSRCHRPHDVPVATPESYGGTSPDGARRLVTRRSWVLPRPPRDCGARRSGGCRGTAGSAGRVTPRRRCGKCLPRAASRGNPNGSDRPGRQGARVFAGVERTCSNALGNQMAGPQCHGRSAARMARAPSAADHDGAEGWGSGPRAGANTRTPSAISSSADRRPRPSNSRST